MDSEQLKFWYGKYQTHKHSAKRRNITFSFTFEEWLKIWVDSGHIHERGTRKGQYVMARNGDIGPYAIENVRIVTTEQNVSEIFLFEPSLLKMRKAKLGTHHRLGKKHTPEAKAKISASMRGRKPPPETMAKLRAANLGRKDSKETRKKKAIACTGWHHTEEAKAKISAYQKTRVISEETKRRLKAAATIKFADPKFRAKLSGAQRRRFAREKAQAQNLLE